MVSFDTASFDTDAHPKEKQMTIDMIMNIFIFAFMITPLSKQSPLTWNNQSTLTIKTEKISNWHLPFLTMLNNNTRIMGESILFS